MPSSATLPQAILDRPQWVCWHYEDDPKHPDKPKKIPYSPQGYRADSTDPHTWGTYDQAVAAAERHGYTGIGYVFSTDDPFVGIDLDDCIDPDGRIAPWASDLLADIVSYAEISPSGRGIKLIVEGTIPANVKKRIVVDQGRIRPAKRDDTSIGGIEMYHRARYFTITGQHLDDMPTTIEPVNGALTVLYEQLAPQQPTAARTTSVRPKSDHAARWTEQKMQQIETWMREEPDGNLHNRRLELGKLAGGLVGLNLISADEAEDRLYHARIPDSHHQQERRAIRDGIEIGMGSPLVMPAFPTEQPIILIAGIGHCPSCDTRIRRSGFAYPGTNENGWYCPQCKHPMVWPLEAYTPLQRDVQATNKADLTYSENCENNSDDSDQCIFNPLHRFEQYNLPSFPLHALPSWLAAFIDAEAEFTQTPVDLGAMVCLSVLATVLQRRVKVEIRPGYTEPVNLFTVVALPPASRKSAVFKACAAPLVDWEAKELLRSAVDIAKAETELEILKGQLQRAKADAVKKTGHAQQQARDDAARFAEQVQTYEMPIKPRVIADDITAEALAKMIADQGGRIAVLASEGGIFDTMAGRYSASGMANFDVYLKAHAGDPLRTDRKHNSEASIVNAPCLTMGITLQPEILQKLSEKSAFKDRGLVGRFLYALPESGLGYREIETAPVPDQIMNEYHTAISILIDMQLDITTTTSKERILKDHSYCLYLSDEARQTINEFARWIEPKLKKYGEFGHMRDWAGKLVGATARIAGLLHMSETFLRYQQPISADTMRRAIEIAHYLIAHARAVYQEMEADEQTMLAKHVWGWIAEQRTDRLSRRDIHQGVKGTIKSPDDLDPVLQELCNRGYLTPAEMPERSGPGRKPSPLYYVNPEARESGQRNVENYSHNSQNRNAGAFLDETNGQSYSHNSQNGHTPADGYDMYSVPGF